MCTLVIAVAPEGEWDVLLASTRDEFRSRAWEPPAEWWPKEYPGVVGGRDRLAGGTWLAALPSRRRAAVVLNRIEPSGLSDLEARSRGDLPLRAVAEGADTIATEDLHLLRPFNLVTVESGAVIWWRYDGTDLSEHIVPPGLHIITASDLDDLDNPRQHRWLPEFEAVALPDPDADDQAPEGWGGWPRLLADVDTPYDDPRALNVRRARPGGEEFGTVSASLLAIGERHMKFDFCPGPPDRTPWRRVV